MIPNIGIVGQAGSGKTTLAQYIVEAARVYNITSRKIALADGVKEIQRELFPALEGKPRKVYQHIGMSMREIDADVWIHRTDNVIRNYEPNIHWIIDDIRIFNEYKHYRDKGWYIVRVKTYGYVRIQRLRERDGDVDMDALQHMTETDLIDVPCDWVAHNNGDEENLRMTASMIVDHLM